MARQLRINPGDITVGKALPWPLYDEHGALVLRQGCTVLSSRHLQTLLKEGLYRDAAYQPEPVRPVRSDTNPFERVARLAGHLDRILVGLECRDRATESEVAELAGQIECLCQQDADAATAAVHLCHGDTYTLCHPLYQSILCTQVAWRIGLADSRRRSLVSAALTANAAIRALQEKLQRQVRPQTLKQQQEIHGHPEAAERMLRESGIEDERWLTVVRQHHERIDGSGYPHGLRSTELLQESQVLGIADRYGAMVGARDYRDDVPAKTALRDFFLRRGTEFDDRLSVLFIKELGIFPPGSFVRLANRETAVVTRRRSNDPLRPIVMSFKGPHGEIYAKPARRDCRDKRYRIKESCLRESILPLDLGRIWEYR